MLGLFEMPQFDTISEAETACEKIIDALLNIQFNDAYTRKGQRNRSRINTYSDHFVAKCRVQRDKHTVRSKTYNKWADLMERMITEKDRMVQTKNDVRSIGVFVQ